MVLRLRKGMLQCTVSQWIDLRIITTGREREREDCFLEDKKDMDADQNAMKSEEIVVTFIKLAKFFFVCSSCNSVS